MGFAARMFRQDLLITEWAKQARKKNKIFDWFMHLLDQKVGLIVKFTILYDFASLDQNSK